MFFLISAALVASAAAIACTDSSSSCPLNCTSTTCTGSVNCSTNADCTLTCNGNRACSGLMVNGLYNPQTGPADFAVHCAGSYDCQNAVYTARTTAKARFRCSGVYSCRDTTFVCDSDVCELVCDTTTGGSTTSCRGMASFGCLGGPGKQCNIQCGGGGCYDNIPVTCKNYPCAVNISGAPLTFVPPCPAGQLLCGGGTCVNSSVTVCPSQCLKNDPCKTAAGNTCADVGTVGGPYNCTCSAANYKNGASIGGLVQYCLVNQTGPETEGTSLTLVTYGNAQCTGSAVSTKVYPSGCGNGLPSAGQFIFSKCTNLHWCQSSAGTGTCGAITLFCNPNIDTNICVNGVIGRCSSGADRASVGVALFGLLSFFAIAQ